MKKIILAICALCAGSAFAALDTYTGSYQASLFPASMVTNPASLTTITGSAFDLVGYKGFATITVSHGAEFNGATNRISIMTIQQTNTVSGGWSVLAAVTNVTASASFTRIPFEVGKGGRYIRGVYTSTNASSAVSASINAVSDQ